MIITYPNQAASVTASSAASEYPAANLLNPAPKMIWRASAAGSAVLSFPIGISSSNDVAVVLTHLKTTASVTARFLTFYGWTAVTGIYYSHTADRKHCVFCLPADILSADKEELEITLTDAASAPEAGCILIGKMIESGDGQNVFRPPSTGLKASLKDYSIYKEYNDGSVYLKKREIAEQIIATVRTDLRTDFDCPLVRLGREIGQEATAFILPGKTVSRFENAKVILGRFSNLPQADKYTNLKSKTGFTISEAI
jgi:hypothetical protein